MKFPVTIFVIAISLSKNVVSSDAVVGSEPVVQKLTAPVNHAEGPYWDSKKKVLFFVDIAGHKVHQYDPSTKKLSFANVGKDVGVVIPIDGTENEFLVGVGRSLSILTWNGSDTESPYVRVLNTVDEDKPDNRFNDGKADPSGRVWIGTMGPEKPVGTVIPNQGTLFRVSKGSCQSDPILSKLTTSNGLAWTRDNRTMFHIDSGPKIIYKSDYDINTGVTSNRQVLVDFEKSGYPGAPDGMTIDDQDNLWVACWNGSRVLNIDSKTGTVISKVKLPVERVTSVTFGGDNYNTLFVTTMRTGLTEEELKHQPDAGAVFSVSNLNVTGRLNNVRAAKCAN